MSPVGQINLPVRLAWDRSEGSDQSVTVTVMAQVGDGDWFIIDEVSHVRDGEFADYSIAVHESISRAAGIPRNILEQASNSIQRFNAMIERMPIVEFEQHGSWHNYEEPESPTKKMSFEEWQQYAADVLEESQKNHRGPNEM
jgi:hypothetical protein